MPPKKKPIATYTFKKIDFSKKRDLLYFDALTVPEKRLYVGRYIKQSDLKCFVRAMLRFRQTGNMKKNSIQQLIHQGLWQNSIRFIQSDYNSESYYSRDGDSLIELAIKSDAKHFTKNSKFILKKVLDDYNYYKKSGKTITSITQSKHLGHLIMTHGRHSEARQDIINYLARHPSTKKRLPHIIDTHHHHEGNIKHLSNYANAIGNAQTARKIRDLLQREENAVHTFNLSKLNRVLNTYYGGSQTNMNINNTKSNSGMSGVLSNNGTIARAPPSVPINTPSRASGSGTSRRVRNTPMPGQSVTGEKRDSNKSVNSQRKISNIEKLNNAMATLVKANKEYTNEQKRTPQVYNLLSPYIRTVLNASHTNLNTLKNKYTNVHTKIIPELKKYYNYMNKVKQPANGSRSNQSTQF